MDVEFLSRLQFAVTITFHYIYPPLSIGLGLILVIMESMWLKTGSVRYHNMARFWTRIFALTFVLGVASGIVMEFEFGTNWATYSRFVGDIFGSALAAEGIFAFFLESGFLAILVFGWDKVGPKIHFFSTCMVCLGSHFSAIWIVVANSWMQTPAGYHLEKNGEALPQGYVLKAEDFDSVRAVVDDFWSMVFNPSSIDRLTHVIIACWLTGAFLVMSISAYYLLRGRHIGFATTSLKVGLAVGCIAGILQLISADSTSRGVAENQPVKLAAIEGLFTTQANAPLSLLGYVDMKEEKTHSIAVPGLLSFLIYRNTDGVVKGLDSYPQADWPKVSALFQLYRVMIAMGILMICLSVVGVIMWRRKNLFNLRSKKTRLFLWLLVPSALFPQLANIAGWYTAEMGRQPWIVYNLMRTSEGVSRAIVANQVLFSMIMFGLIYILLFAMFIFLLSSKIHKGPSEREESEYSLEQQHVVISNQDC